MLQSNSFNYLLLIPGKNRKPHVQSQLRLCAVGLRAVPPEQVRRAGQGAAGTACSHHPGGTLSSSLPPEPYCAGLDSIISGGPFQPIQFCDSVWYYKGKGIHTLASCIAEAYILQNWAQHTMKWSYLKNEETFKMQGETYALQVILSPPWEQGLPVPWILTARNEFFLCATSH